MAKVTIYTVDTLKDYLKIVQAAIDKYGPDAPCILSGDYGAVGSLYEHTYQLDVTDQNNVPLVQFYTGIMTG